MNSHRTVRASSFEEFLGSLALPMEQDDAGIATSRDGTSAEESKDGFVTVKKTLKAAATKTASSQPPAATPQTISSQTKTAIAYAAKAAAGSSQASSSLAQRKTSKVLVNPGTVTADYGFRYTNPTQDHLVYIILYKTERCNRKPCARTCEKYHSVKERRRNPLQFEYSEQPCQNVKAGASSRAWGDPSKCPEGDDCQFSHTLLEQMYHPNIYKTGMCNKFTSDPATNNCSWGALCTHAHGPQDRDRQVRALEKFRELFEDGITEWFIESISASSSGQTASESSAPSGSVAVASDKPSLSKTSSVSSVSSDRPLASKQNSLELHLRVEDDTGHSAVSENDPILRTPVESSPSYDATLNRTQGAPFLSSFSNISVPQKPVMDRPSSMDRNPIGPVKRTSNNGLIQRLDLVSSSPLTQVMNLSSLPVVSPSGTSQKPNKLERALSGPSSIARPSSGFSSSGSSSPSIGVRAPGVGFPMLSRPATVTTLVGPGGTDGIWGGGFSNFGGVSWDPSTSFSQGGFLSASESESKMIMQSSKTASLSEEELKKQVDNLKLKILCPECRAADRSMVLIPCRHYLCNRCADQSSRQRQCMQCSEECHDILAVEL
eukprot:TRINITY_DN811_c0_g1_i1.p1 TRINITY_DN811_c0_g1~~TRINITY_DN811_c0_g1_i1.p1  ORF type:complete len:605 (+),score=115.46 TRINITY_DN811_c0_g1_i1:146-1960(+)